MRTTLTTQEKWQELIREQEQSKVSVTVFCREHGVSDQSFYTWRKRLAAPEPIRFALVDSALPATQDKTPIELILAGGDRLRIPSGIDAATLRTLLSVLRERA